MAILREFRCAAHDLAFEAYEESPACPAGCSPKFVVREFRTAPGIKHAGTRVADTMARQLAQDYNLTDMKNDKEGASVMSTTRTQSGGTRVIGNTKPQAYWNPGLFPVRQGWAQRGEPAPTFNPGAHKVVDGGVPIKTVAEGAKQHLKRATVFAKPKGAK